MRLWIVFAAVALVFLVPGTSRGQEQPAAEGWIPLFNGKDLDGWTKMHEGNWSVENGNIRYQPPGSGWLRSNEPFADFQLIVEWRFTNAKLPNDAGLFVRASGEGKPFPTPAYQVNMGPGSNLGSLGSMRGAPKVQGSVQVPQLVRPPGGEWNTYDLIMVGNAATFIVNGQKAWDASGVGLPGGGYIGWQCEGFPFEIRSVRVRKLSPGSKAKG